MSGLSPVTAMEVSCGDNSPTVRSKHNSKCGTEQSEQTADSVKMDIMLDCGSLLQLWSLPVKNDAVCSDAGKGESGRHRDLQTKQTDKFV